MSPAPRRPWPLDRIVDQARDVAQGERDVLRIGVVLGISSEALHTLLTRCLTREPGLRLEISEGAAQQHRLALQRGRLDIAFLPGRAGGADVCPAWRERLTVAVQAGAPLAQTTAIAWNDLAGVRLLVAEDIAGEVRDILGRRVQLDGPGGLCTLAASSQTVVRLAALGQGVGIVTESCAARSTGVVFRPLPRAFLSFQAVVGRRSEKPALRRLLAMLADAARPASASGVGFGPSPARDS